MILDRDPEFRATITYYFIQELGHPPNDEQMAAYLLACRNGMTGPQIQQILHAEPEAVAYRARPKPLPLPSFTVSDREFISPGGQRLSLCGTDGFMDLRKFIDGGAAAVDAEFAESRELNFIVRRVFCMGAASQNQVMDLWPQRVADYLPTLRAYVQYANIKGIIPLLTVRVDAQVVMPNEDEQNALWDQFPGTLAGLRYLLSAGNEHQKNGFDPDRVHALPAGVIWSRGSGLSDQKTAPHGAPAAEFHQRRDNPKSILDAVASWANMRFEVPGYEHALLWMDEPKKFDDSTTVDEAFQFGRLYATFWALAVFHNFFGQRGLPMDTATRDRATAFERGMRL